MQEVLKLKKPVWPQPKYIDNGGHFLGNLVCKKCKESFQKRGYCMANGFGFGHQTKDVIVYVAPDGKWYHNFHDEFKLLDHGHCITKGCDGEVELIK